MYRLVSELGELPAGCAEDLIVIAQLVKLARGVRQKLCARVHQVGLYSACLEPCRDRSCDKRDDQHYYKGDRVLRVVGVQCEQRLCKEEIEHDHRFEGNNEIY